MKGITGKTYDSAGPCRIGCASASLLLYRKSAQIFRSSSLRSSVRGGRRMHPGKGLKCRRHSIRALSIDASASGLYTETNNSPLVS